MATALVLMDESAGALDLEDIRLAVRASTPLSCSYTAWQRFGVSIPQIKVETRRQQARDRQVAGH
jgi:hypothetical protein